MFLPTSAALQTAQKSTSDKPDLSETFRSHEHSHFPSTLYVTYLSGKVRIFLVLILILKRLLHFRTPCTHSSSSSFYVRHAQRKASFGGRRCQCAFNSMGGRGSMAPRRGGGIRHVSGRLFCQHGRGLQAIGTWHWRHVLPRTSI